MKIKRPQQRRLHRKPNKKSKQIKNASNQSKRRTPSTPKDFSENYNKNTIENTKERHPRPDSRKKYLPEPLIFAEQRLKSAKSSGFANKELDSKLSFIQRSSVNFQEFKNPPKGTSLETLKHAVTLGIDILNTLDKTIQQQKLSGKGSGFRNQTILNVKSTIENLVKKHPKLANFAYKEIKKFLPQTTPLIGEHVDLLEKLESAKRKNQPKPIEKTKKKPRGLQKKKVKIDHIAVANFLTTEIKKEPIKIRKIIVIKSPAKEQPASSLLARACDGLINLVQTSVGKKVVLLSLLGLAYAFS